MLDSGNALFNRNYINDLKRTKPLFEANKIIQIYEYMHYDAVAVGPKDLAAGLNFLHSSMENGFPWISANIYNAENKLIFKPFVTVKIGNLTVGIIGLTNPAVHKTDSLNVSNGKTELETLLPKLTKTHDLIILLSSLPFNELVQLAQNSPDIDLIISSDERNGNITDPPINNTIIVQTKSQGKYLGQLFIRWNNSKWGEDISFKRKSLKSNLLSINRQITTLKKRNKEQDESFSRRKAQIYQNKEKIIAELKQLDIDNSDPGNNPKTSTYSNMFIPLHSSLPKDPEVDTIIRTKK